MSMVKAACVQMSSGPDIEENLKTAEGLVREAAGQGAQFVALPENACHIRFPAVEKLDSALPEDKHPGIPFFSNLSKELGVYLLVGSMAIKIEGDKLLNRSFLFSDDGSLAAVYDKIHLFDVDLPNGETYKESDVMQPGDKAVIAKTPWGGLGMSICYDLRFAYLYRDLAQNGAQIMAVPAAFTVPTGKAHWATLLRARAIETGSFLLAPAQTGEHEGGRKTWGHSMIINPWGEVLAEMGEETGFITAGLNLKEVHKARQAIPALKHDRPYALETSG